jgi:hypothetical protein
MQFAMILTGANAPAPAPRVAAIPSQTGIGLYDPASREIWQPCRAAIRAALPARLRRHIATGCTVWHDSAARMDESGRLVGGNPPYMEIRNARGAYLATVYFLPVNGSAGA